MAIAVGKTKPAARLGLDVRAAELFYHPSCMRDVKNQYNRVKLTTESKYSSDQSIKDDPLANFAELETLRYHILESPLNHFTCSELEKVYRDKLNSFGAETSSHTTRFVSELLENHADDLGVSIIQKSWNIPYQVLRKSTFKVSLATIDWCDLLRNVVDPIRAEILERPLPSDMADLEVGEEVTVNKLNMLITLLCDKDPSCVNLSNPLETICQMIVMQTKKFPRPRNSRQKYHYSHSRNLLAHTNSQLRHRMGSKTLWLFPQQYVDRAKLVSKSCGSNKIG